MTRLRNVLLAAMLLGLVASSASAGLFTVTLTNGTTFETRYRPVEAEWDDNIVMIRTDRGNWIALDKADIADLVSETEVSGFGYQLNTTTIFLGWSPNDIVDDGDGEDGEEGDGTSASPGSEGDDSSAPLLYGDETDDSGIGFDEFLDIPDAGQGLGGGISLGGPETTEPGGG
ncbi:MAG: hypothetical protein AAGE94_21745 [Acidobacteriota bacterium]